MIPYGRQNISEADIEAVVAVLSTRGGGGLANLNGC